ncbi:MAG: choice-of-anchor Q domain-containing protein, partial [Actinomycetota bacterium]
SPSAVGATVLKVTKLTDDAPGACTPSDCSLREAVIAANKTDVVETVKLGPGTHQLSIAGPDEDKAASGDVDITRPVKIVGTPGVTPTLIDQTTNDRVLHVRGKGTLKLTAVNITGGTAFPRGGGILGDANRKITLVRSALTFNSATGNGGGGGIYTEGPLKMTDSFIFDNDTPFGGGGITAIGANATIIRTGIFGNSAGGNDGHGGGGINFQGPGTLTVVDSTVEANDTGGNGGGISARSFSVEGLAPFTMQRSTVANNTSGGSGGGLFITKLNNQSTVFRIDDSTISDNSSNIAGGGIFCGCPSPAAEVTHTTITDNTADADNNHAPDFGEGDGGGIAGSGVQMEFLASILGDNHDIGSNPAFEDCGDFVAFSLGSNVTTEAGCFNNSEATDATVGTLDFLDALDDNGGPTETHALDGTATAVDRHVGEGCDGTDQRGVPRPVGAGCDSGAYEHVLCDERVVDIVGTKGADEITGTSGDDGILGLGGNDKIDGGDGNDSVCGGGGNDKIAGGLGMDSLFGEKGDDKLDGGADIDGCDGGPGTDKIINCEA